MLALILAACLTHAADSPTKTITDFYAKYFAHLMNEGSPRPEPEFSAAYLELRKKETAACEKISKNEPCGFGSDGDIYIDAQDFGDTLNMKNTGFTAKESKPGIVVARFDIFPGLKKFRQITYHMVREKNRWVVDDIDVGGLRARKAMEDTIRENKP